jgi:hypothetical protein
MWEGTRRHVVSEIQHLVASNEYLGVLGNYWKENYRSFDSSSHDISLYVGASLLIMHRT